MGWSWDLGGSGCDGTSPETVPNNVAMSYHLSYACCSYGFIIKAGQLRRPVKTQFSIQHLIKLTSWHHICTLADYIQSSQDLHRIEKCQEHSKKHTHSETHTCKYLIYKHRLDKTGMIIDSHLVKSLQLTNNPSHETWHSSCKMAVRCHCAQPLSSDVNIILALPIQKPSFIL